MKILKWAGISVFILALVANLQLALLDYGLSTNSLSYQVFAQTGGTGGGTTGGGTTGGGTTGGGGWLWKDFLSESTCTYKAVTTYWVCGTVIYYSYVAGCTETTGELTFVGVMKRCDDGWDPFCSERCVGAG